MKRRICPKLEILEGRSLLSGLVASLTTNQSVYQPGQPIVMTFQETNASSQAVDVDNGPSIDGFMVSHDGDVVWRSNAGINPMFIVRETLQPGQSLTLTATWDGIPTGGTAAVPGQYLIANQLNPLAATATVTISGPGSTPSSPSGPGGGGSDPVSSTVGDKGPTSLPAPRDPQPDPPSAMPAGASSPVALSVTTHLPTYRAGHRVRMTLRLRNEGDHPIVFTPGASETGFTVLEGNTPIWHSTGEASGLHARRLRPGQSIQVRAIWDGRPDLAGAALAPGSYTIEATADGQTAVSTLRIIP